MLVISGAPYPVGDVEQGAALREPLIFDGLNVLEVAPKLGHKPSTCLDVHGCLFEKFDPAHRRAAVDVIEEGRTRAVPSGYPAEPAI